MSKNNLTHGGPAGTNPTPNTAAIENIKDLVERFYRKRGTDNREHSRGRPLAAWQFVIIRRPYW